MDVVRRVSKGLPAIPRLPTPHSIRTRSKNSRGLAYFKRPMRLRSNSNISIPLGVLLLFPCIVVVIVLVLLMKHPSSTASSILLPAGAPPAIRHVLLMGLGSVEC